VTPELTDDIYRAADAVGRRWADVIGPDDLAQEMWVRLLERNYFEQLAALDEPARHRTLCKIASQIASRERDDHDAFTGQIYYGTTEVRAMLRENLEHGFIDVEQAEGQFRLDAEKFRGIALNSLTLTVMLDLTEALERLARHAHGHAAVIRSVFVLREEPPHHQTVTRAVEALTRYMNRIHTGRSHESGPGSRRPRGQTAE
jgi:hypothetical protein